MRHNTESIDCGHTDCDSDFTVIKNHGIVEQSTNFPVDLVKSGKNSGLKLIDCKNAERLDLKSIMTSFRSTCPTADIWISKKGCYDGVSHLPSLDLDNGQSISSLKSSSVNAYCTHLERKGLERKVVQLMLSSMLPKTLDWPSVNDHRGQNLSGFSDKMKNFEVDEAVVQFVPKLKSQRLVWDADVDLTAKPCSGEPFRTPAVAHRDLVHSKLCLLDDHCFQLGRKRSSPPVGLSGDEVVSETSPWLPQNLQRRLSPDADAGEGGEGVHRGLQHRHELESALARHSEAVTDAVLDMVSAAVPTFAPRR